LFEVDNNRCWLEVEEEVEEEEEEEEGDDNDMRAGSR
jgi:hypothetical protein